MNKPLILVLLNILVICSAHVVASEADVIDAEVKREYDGSFTFNVTVQHADEGWNHYADHWLILNRERISNVLSSDMSSTVGVYAIKKLWVYHCPHA